MAEGGDAVDSGKNVSCNICEDAGSNGPYFYCVSCEQYLCEECKRHHSRVKATKSHEVIEAGETAKFASRSLESDSLESPMCVDHKRPITYFCMDHMTELCHSCHLVEHKICSNITNFEMAVKDVFTHEHSKHIRKGLEDLVSSFSKVKSTAQSNKDRLNESKQSAIDNIKQARKTVDSHLDNIEAEAYNEVEKKFKTEMKQIEDQLHVCDVILFELQKRLSKLETIMALDDKDSEFVTVNKVTKEIKRQCNLLKTTIADTCDIDFTFRNSDSIDKVTKLLPCLGTISVTKSPASQTDPGTVAIYTGELKPTTATDTDYPTISSYQMLPDGRLILTDQHNRKIKLFNSNNQFLSELALQDMPLSLVLLNATEAVASLPNINSLQYITVGTDLALSKTKKVNYRPLAIVKYGDDILAAVRDEFCKVVVIDSNGLVRRTIYKDNGSLLSKPYDIDLSVDQKTVYIVDMVKGCIGLSMDGNVVFQYQDQKVEHYVGLAIGTDCVFIGVWQDDEWNVRRLSCSGDHMEDCNFGLSWPRKIIENVLIVCNSDNEARPIQFFYLL